MQYTLKIVEDETKAMEQARRAVIYHSRAAYQAEQAAAGHKRYADLAKEAYFDLLDELKRSQAAQLSCSREKKKFILKYYLFFLPLSLGDRYVGRRACAKLISLGIELVCVRRSEYLRSSSFFALHMRQGKE